MYWAIEMSSVGVRVVVRMCRVETRLLVLSPQPQDGEDEADYPDEGEEKEEDE